MVEPETGMDRGGVGCAVDEAGVNHGGVGGGPWWRDVRRAAVSQVRGGCARGRRSAA